MAKEIERKFLVLNDSFKEGLVPVYIRQGFISTDKNRVIRVRIAGTRASLTLKTGVTGITRNEYEYAIPLEDAREILDRMCSGFVIEKYRYLVEHENHKWEVDVFMGENKGLVIAEIELKTEHEKFKKPNWLGDEVTHDERYYNAMLVKHPFADW
ncbi:MAG: CYTH domain-containing protein [Bacteroidales bacterium]|nr:CYTH domain-containing protein [Bacteroidales bacterium]